MMKYSVRAVVGTMLDRHIHCLLFMVLVPLVCSVPFNHDIDHGPLAAVSDLNSAVSSLSSHVASRTGLLQTEHDPRLGLPSPQDIETIKKVAQILITLGDQILPPMFGERPSRPPGSSCEVPPPEIPNDTVHDK